MAERTLVLDAGAVARLNWQPRICPPPLECIASRRGDTLELILGPTNPSRPIKGRRHYYRITPLTDTTILATPIDEDVRYA